LWIHYWNGGLYSGNWKHSSHIKFLSYWSWLPNIL
jgi:hypothetical protein